MFEGALVESRGQLGSPVVRWTAVASLMVQSLVAAAFVALPILKPDTLHMLAKAPELIAPAVPKPAPIVRVRVTQAAASPGADVPSAPEQVANRRSIMRNLLPTPLGQDEPVPLGPGMPIAMAGGRMEGFNDIIGAGSRVGSKVVRAVPAGPVRVSSGVSTGMLLSAIQPVYPALAKAARVEGTVVVEAMISKTGGIESARALSGPEMLRGAAVAAVSGARYRPFELNGQPVEVQTTITVNFRLHN